MLVERVGKAAIVTLQAHPATRATALVANASMARRCGGCRRLPRLAVSRAPRRRHVLAGAHENPPGQRAGAPLARMQIRRFQGAAMSPAQPSRPPASSSVPAAAQPADPAPVDLAEESAAGEEDPGASLDLALEPTPDAGASAPAAPASGDTATPPKP
jgi:hypothetical protein